MGDTAKQFSLQNFRPEGFAYPIGLSFRSYTSLDSTGGTQTIDGTNAVHTFTSSGEFVSNFTSNVELLLVGGGGASAGEAPGGAVGAGAGGAGGLVYHSDFPVIIGTPYTVTIGAGGVKSVGTGTPGGTGSNTVFDTAYSYGGGGGGFYTAGTVGGSGGGGGYIPGEPSGALMPAPSAGTANSSPSFVPSPQLGNGTAYGNPGGRCYGYIGGGGGGGAGATGGNGSPPLTPTIGHGGLGGVGLFYSISGANTGYCGGGGGGGYYNGTNPVSPVGGDGGGGAGAYISPGPTLNNAVNGTSNRGGGGGGGVSTMVAGNGGSGVAIVRYNVTSGDSNYFIN